MSDILAFIIVIVVAVLAFAAGAVLAKRKGYKETGELVVRCGRGHLFTTVWAGNFSYRRIDLGFARIQRCPVDDHLTLVRPVDISTLTPEEKKIAKQTRDDPVR